MLKGQRLAFDKLSNDQLLTSSQRLFIDEFMLSAKRLFKLMDVHGDDCLAYRLYDCEVVELNHEVSVLVLVPPAECSCAVPGQKELLLQRADLISISVQSFEMNHLRTYQSRIIEKYSRLSCILELETVFAAHSQREAFSQAELQVARERVQKLQELSQSLNGVWKGVRWVMDVIGFARDKSPACSQVTMEGVRQIWRQYSGGGGGVVSGISGLQRHLQNRAAVQQVAAISNTVATGSSTSSPSSSSRHLLELPSPSAGRVVMANNNNNNENSIPQKPPMKTSPGRGSWPGPTVSDHLFLGDQEHSRSEQQLTIKGGLGLGGSQQYLGVRGKVGGGSGGGSSSSRKNSADSNASQQSETMSCSSAKTVPYQRQGSVDGTQRMQGSRSEDTLNVCREQGGGAGGGGQGGAGRKRTTTSSCTRLGREQGEEEEDGDGFQKPRPVSLHGGRVKGQQGDQQHQQQEAEKKKKGGEETMLEFSTIQVYAAYETGLTNGTSLKLHVTTETTSREVVDLVVKQLNMAVLLKGKEGPIYGERDLQEFCLVAIIGARERCLRDDFKPLQLQNPWRKGRLYVRKRMDVLAALEHNNSQAKMI